jgi:hypothetical protein
MSEEGNKIQERWRKVRKNYHCYSDTTCEVGQLERCLDAVEVALTTLEVETITTLVATTDA